MTALAMSNPLSTLDLSDLPDPYLRPVSSSPASPPHPPPHLSTASTPNSRSTSALNYHNYNPVTPTTLDVWIAANQPGQAPDTPDLSLVRAPSSHPPDLFSSFLQPTPRAQPRSQPPTTHARSCEIPTSHAITEATLQLEHPIPLNQTSPPNSIPQHTRTTSALSRAFTQPDRMIYTAPVRTPAPSQTAPLATQLITPMFSNTSDGLSAVERAKKTADHFTMSQLAKKRKAAGLDPDPKRARNVSSSKSSTDDDDKNDENLPERVSHRKYQKRLQKNRDSAFVSRIRRREYTRLLEESLTTTEKEKDAAVNNLLEMKRRFDIVSAELSAFKQAAASNLSAVRDSLFSRLSTTTTDTQPARSGSVVTSMFMFTLLCGILFPDCIRQRFGLQRYSADSQLSSHGALPGVTATQQNGIRSMFFGNTFSQDSHHVNESRGKVWGTSVGTVYLNDKLDKSEKSCREDSLKTIRSGSFNLLGADHSESFLRLVQPYLEELSAEQMTRLDDVFRHGNATRFEQLVEIEALTRKVARQEPSRSKALLEYVTLQLENTRL